jgi:class 3 adenylate cyclase
MAKGDLRRTGRRLRHTGEVEVSYDDIAGLAVTIAKRVRDLAGAEGVLVSETVGGLMVGSYEDQHLVHSGTGSSPRDRVGTHSCSPAPTITKANDLTFWA